MRTRRPTAPLELTPAERATLESLAHRSRTRPHVARRARLILLCGDGLAGNVVARKLHVRDQTVSKWRARFRLYDEPRPGAPRTIDDAAVERVVIRTLETTPRGQTHWSLRGLAAATGLSRMTISRIWHAFGLAAASQRDLQALAHKTPPIRRWFAKRPRSHVHFTPTYGSWLNMVERWFAELRNKQGRRGVHRSIAELELAIRTFIDVHNADPKPFVWTIADQILSSIARFAQRTTDDQCNARRSGSRPASAVRSRFRSKPHPCYRYWRDALTAMGEPSTCDAGIGMEPLGRVLVVDDEPRVIAMTRDLLIEFGYVVKTVSTGAEALGLMPVFQPEVVLLDVFMPGMTGDEVLDRLRREYPGVRVVMVTATQDGHAARQLLARGAFDYVAKPFELDVLERVVGAAVASARP